jgi:hypothetical protein
LHYSSFKVALDEFQATIVEEDLIADIGELRKQTFSDWEALKEAILPLCHLCWTGEKQTMTRAEILKWATRWGSDSPLVVTLS